MKEFMEQGTEDIHTLSEAGRDENLGSAIRTERRREALPDHSTTPSDTTAHRPATADPYHHTRKTLRGDMVTQEGSRRLEPCFPIVGQFRLLHDNPSD